MSGLHPLFVPSSMHWRGVHGMWEGSKPGGVSLSQALGEEGQTWGGGGREGMCLSFTLATVVSPLVSHPAVLPSISPVLLSSFPLKS